MAGRSLVHSCGGEARCLLRYLRLAALQPAKAAEAVRATLQFREDFHVETAEAELRESGAMGRILPHWCCAAGPVAPDGSPVLYWRAAALDATELFKHVDERTFTQFFCYWMERGLAVRASPTTTTTHTTTTTPFPAAALRGTLAYARS